MMMLIEKQEYVQGVNFKQKIPYNTLRQLMSSNSQYIIELAIDLKM
jgi:hypothetical protein